VPTKNISAKGGRVVGPVDQIHLVSRDLKEGVFYPPHAPRKATPEYRAMHKKLVVDQNRPCLACGVTNSILKDLTTRADLQKNPDGAKQIETHHRIVEWSLTNAIDLEKFNHRVLAGMRRHHPGDLRYQNDFTQQQMVDFIDHDEENIWVLCDVHHRHSFVGIHSITGPIWGPQDLLKPGYQYTPYKPEETAAASKATKSGAKAPARKR
jgi:hypothetical protein